MAGLQTYLATDTPGRVDEAAETTGIDGSKTGTRLLQGIGISSAPAVAKIRKQKLTHKMRLASILQGLKMVK